MTFDYDLAKSTKVIWPDATFAYYNYDCTPIRVNVEEGPPND